MYGTYIGGNRLLIQTKHAGTLIAPADEQSIIPQLMVEGQIDPSLTSFLVNHLTRGQIVVDIGATIGYFSLLMASLVGGKGKCLSYEADPYCYRYLTDNIFINHYQDRVTSHSLAPFSDDAPITLHTHNQWINEHAFKNPSHRYPPHFADTVEANEEIHGVSLDEHLYHLPYIDLIKIDVKGDELQTLMGLTQLVKDKIGTLLFSFNREDLHNDLPHFKEILLLYQNYYGKSLFKIDPLGEPIPVDIQHVIEHSPNCTMIVAS
ncbi:FkbM family methyltransferase [Marininema halotolerans]|uniref:Methyltransferase, FkbM family n=1 Tax=Marininema halotolerans TaxID=1155944 RepID=A0A1I6TZ77_9BACL|nr:FkbM family methyltransferase [Marininema halotolerans]SFS94454.1 methyltransferase, FkbM family [Marininema halotolerans]